MLDDIAYVLYLFHFLVDVVKFWGLLKKVNSNPNIVGFCITAHVL